MCTSVAYLCIVLKMCLIDVHRGWKAESLRSSGYERIASSRAAVVYKLACFPILIC